MAIAPRARSRWAVSTSSSAASRTQRRIGRLDAQQLEPSPPALLGHAGVERRPVEGGAAAAARGPLLARAEVEDVAEHHVAHRAALGHRDRERVMRQAALGVPRAVERIDDDEHGPGRIAVEVDASALLAEDREAPRPRRPARRAARTRPLRPRRRSPACDRRPRRACPSPARAARWWSTGRGSPRSPASRPAPRRASPVRGRSPDLSCQSARDQQRAGAGGHPLRRPAADPRRGRHREDARAGRALRVAGRAGHAGGRRSSCSRSRPRRRTTCARRWSSASPAPTRS